MISHLNWRAESVEITNFDISIILSWFWAISGFFLFLCFTVFYLLSTCQSITSSPYGDKSPWGRGGGGYSDFCLLQVIEPSPDLKPPKMPTNFGIPQTVPANFIITKNKYQDWNATKNTYNAEHTEIPLNNIVVLFHIMSFIPLPSINPKITVLYIKEKHEKWTLLNWHQKIPAKNDIPPKIPAQIGILIKNSWQNLDTHKKKKKKKKNQSTNK